MVARLNLHPDRRRAVVHPDHVLTTNFRRAAEIVEASCSCGVWLAQQYVGYWHQPVDFNEAHAAHVTHALTNTPKEPPMPKTLSAGRLGTSHIGSVIRVTTVDGVTIEDRLTRVEHAVYGADKAASTRVHFANVQPAGLQTASAFLLGQASAFKVHPDTIVAVTAGPAE